MGVNWKKVWTWLKHYWYWPVIVILLIFSVTTGARSREKLFGLLAKQKENYEKEIQVIKEVTEEADKKKTEIFTNHIEEVERIEEEHDIKLEELEEALLNSDIGWELTEAILKILKEIFTVIPYNLPKCSII